MTERPSERNDRGLCLPTGRSTASDEIVIDDRDEVRPSFRNYGCTETEYRRSGRADEGAGGTTRRK